MLQRIKLQNFRRFADASLDFSNGITVINGGNGVGKSTIIEAVEWGFYNRTKKETLLTSIRNKNNPDSEVKVTIYFVFGGHEYTLERILTPKNSTTALVYDTKDPEKIYAKGTSGVNDFITKLFGIGHQAFTTSFIAKQKEIDSLGAFKNEERKQFFIKLLGLQVLDKIKPEVRRDLRGAKEALSLLRNQLPDISVIDADIKKLDSQIRDCARSEAKLQKAQQQLDDKLKTAKNKQLASETGYRRYLQLTETQRTLAESTATLEQRRNENDTQIAQLSPFEKEEINVDEIDALIVRLENERDNYRRLAQFQDAITDAKQKVKALTNDIALKEEDRKRLESELPEGTQDLAEIQNSHLQKSSLLSKLKAQLEMRQAQYDDIAKLMESVDQGLITQCPTCYSDLSGSAEGIAHIKHEQKNNNKQILSLRFQIDDLSEEISAIAEDIRDKRTRKESYDGLMAKINTITALISSYDKNRVEAMRSETDLLAKVKDIDTRNYAHPNLFETEQELQQVKGKRQRLSAIVEKINNLRHLREDNERIKTTLDKNAEEQAIGAASLREINFSEDRYDKLNAEVNEIAETLAETREQLIQHRADRQIMENNLKNKNQEHDRADKIRTEVEGYRETIHVFSLVDEIMTQLRLDLANRITPKLGEYTSNYLRDITDGLYQNIVLDENYNIKVLVDNEEWPLAQMSGGEQDVINLCMRLAISQIILESKNVPYNMIILDEIFGSQDDERKLAIIDVIGRLKAIFPQIILITHINEVKDRADTIIDIAKDAKGNSYVLR